MFALAQKYLSQPVFSYFTNSQNTGGTISYFPSSDSKTEDAGPDTLSQLLSEKSIEDDWVDLASPKFALPEVEKQKANFIKVQKNNSAPVELADGLYSYEVTYSPDMRIMPTQKIEDAKEITIGDIHGNFFRLMYDLVVSGALKISSQDTWNKLRIIAIFSDDLTEEQYNEFVSILEKEVSVPENAPKVIFIGDMLADRQTNDILMLTLLSFFTEQKLDFIINISNHDLVFLRYYFYGILPEGLDGTYKSLKNYIQFLERVKSKEVWKTKFNQHIKNYINHLKLFNIKTKIDTLICHATVEKEEILNLFALLNFIDLNKKTHVENENTESMTIRIKDLYWKNIDIHKIRYKTDIFYNYKDYKEIVPKMEEIFESIKSNLSLFKFFISTQEAYNFAWKRLTQSSEADLEPPLAGLKIILQGHDRNQLFFKTQKGLSAPAKFEDSDCNYARYTFDNYVGKNGITQTKYKEVEQVSYIGVFTKNQN